MPRQKDMQRVLRANEQVAHAQRELLAALATLEAGCPDDPIDCAEDWEVQGAHDAAHWISMALQVSYWRASRWLESARALESLPAIAEAFERGRLSLYSVMELSRFATPEDDDALSAWAQEVSLAQVIKAADRACAKVEEARQASADRSLEYCYTDGGSRFFLTADLTGADGAIVAARLDALAAEVPVLPGEEQSPGFDPDTTLGTRRADALVALCGHGSNAAVGSELPGGANPDLRASHGIVPKVLVHTSLDSLADFEAASHIEGGPPICRETLERVLCNASVQALLEDRDGNVMGVGRTSRKPTKAMMRQLRYRDVTCVFPGCSHSRFTQAHHVVWWSKGGRTDLDNLALVCTFHHTLVHEHHWRLERDAEGGFAWFQPNGTRCRAGPVAA